MMPHIDGFAVCRLAREMYDIPIMFLTAKSDEDDKLKGYEYGADDYMTKPFSPKILLAKVNALLRRSKMSDQKDVLMAGEIVLQPVSHTVTVSGEVVGLTHKEYELLLFLSEIKIRYFPGNSC